MLGHFGMIPLINHDFSFGRTGSGRDEIYPDYWIVNPTKPKTTNIPGLWQISIPILLLNVTISFLQYQMPKRNPGFGFWSFSFCFPCWDGIHWKCIEVEFPMYMISEISKVFS